jgi:hypothetical protein
MECDVCSCLGRAEGAKKKSAPTHDAVSRPQARPQSIALGDTLYKATALMKDRRFLLKLLAVEAAILMGAYFVMTSIQLIS